MNLMQQALRDSVSRIMAVSLGMRGANVNLILTTKVALPIFATGVANIGNATLVVRIRLTFAPLMPRLTAIIRETLSRNACCIKFIQALMVWRNLLDTAMRDARNIIGGIMRGHVPAILQFSWLNQRTRWLLRTVVYAVSALMV